MQTPRINFCGTCDYLLIYLIQDLTYYEGFPTGVIKRPYFDINNLIMFFIQASLAASEYDRVVHFAEEEDDE